MWRRRPVVVALTAVVVVLAGWLVTLLATSSGPTTSAPNPAVGTTTAVSPTVTADSATSPFTGLSGPVAPVLVVKIDNFRSARPQLGLTMADLVYVEPVEGGLSRLAAVFSSRLPQTFGPVRSARETDIGLFAQFGRSALAYSGAAPELLPQVCGRTCARRLARPGTAGPLP